jgi:HPt (histidine-containing phosphotransfer) domain-containing protein
MTANAIFGMREMFLQNGFNDFISKPVEISKLNEIISKWIPKEKLLKAPKKETYTETPSFLEIEGLDVAAGLTSVGGSQPRYLELLEIFRRDIAARLERLQTPDEARRKAFITQVHALKSGLANIGAYELSRSAALLEKAGNDDDMDTVQKHIAGFREALTILYTRIGVALAELHTKDGEQQVDLERETLDRLQAALQSRRIDAIDEALQSMKTLPLSSETRELVADIEELILVSDFEKAEDSVRKLLY